MLKSIEVQGRTEDEAIELALEQLGLSRDDVSVEILETAKKGILGIKNTPAVVKVEYEANDDGDAVPAGDVAESSYQPPRDKPYGRSRKQSNTIPADAEFIEKVDKYLKGLFELMELDVTIDISDKDGAVFVDLKAADPGLLIGRRGETLDALQHLTNYSLNRSPGGHVRIHLDTENYKQRRGEALESLARRSAGKVVKYRRNLTLDPMNAYERHIIHTTLQDHELVSTYSVGSENNRRVVIAYGQGRGNTQERTGSPQYKEWH